MRAKQETRRGTTRSQIRIEADYRDALVHTSKLIEQRESAPSQRPRRLRPDPALCSGPSVRPLAILIDFVVSKKTEPSALSLAVPRCRARPCDEQREVTLFLS